MGFRIVQKNNSANKDNNGFGTENNRKYHTIQPMKYSIQQEILPYPFGFGEAGSLINAHKNLIFLGKVEKFIT